jgi:hypothetical protein
MELLIWAVLCALIGLGCLGGAAWAVLGGEDVGVELIFLLHVWLLFAAIFLGMAFWIARQGPLKKQPANPGGGSKDEKIGKKEQAKETMAAP